MPRETLARPNRNLALSLTLSLLIAGAGTVFVLHPGDAVSGEIAQEPRAYGIQPQDLSLVASASDIIVEGVVRKVEPVRWTTADGKRPTDLETVIRRPDVQLRTPVLLKVEEVYQGDVKPGMLRFSMPGSRSDDLQLHSIFGIELKDGMRILAFLSRAPQDAGAWAKISPLYPQLFFVVDEDTLHGPERSISWNELLDQLSIGE